MEKYKFEMYATSTKFWYRNGKQHRGNDKSAAIWANGSKLWYWEGLLHRERDLPAL